MITYSKLRKTGELDTVMREVGFQTDKPGIGDEVAACLFNRKLEGQLLEWAT